jgi:hypothetical protein
MEKIKFKLSSWEKGEKFIQELANKLQTEVETRDARQIIETDGGKITFHPDDRGFAFITCKLSDEKLKPIVIETRDNYQ